MDIRSIRTFVVAAVALSVSFVWFGTSASQGSDLSTVRNQFSASQWSALRRLKHSAIILPSYVPDGYRVTSIEVHRNQLTLGGEAYYVTYGDGSNDIQLYVSNVEAGGDAPPESFRVEYHSRFLGSGVIYSVDDATDPISGRRATCWVTGRHTGASIAGENYDLSACGPQRISAETLARMIESMYLVSNLAPSQVNDIWNESVEKHHWVVWTLAQTGGRYSLDSAYYPEADDPCSGGNETFSADDSRIGVVRRYYENWDDDRLVDAWNALSSRYQHEYGHARWLSDHAAVRDIGAVNLCILGADKVAANVWWVNK